jgi:hypothetical protein
MKRLFWILLITLLASAMWAQTGLFDLSYGMGKDEALETLDTNGFTVSNETDYWIEAVPVDNYYVEKMELTFSESSGGLTDWWIVYLEQEDEDIESLVMEALEERHGYDYYYDDYAFESSWDLGDGHYVYAGWDWDYATFYVEYTTE